jgi:hypothetical protein
MHEDGVESLDVGDELLRLPTQPVPDRFQLAKQHFVERPWTDSTKVYKLVKYLL